MNSEGESHYHAGGRDRCAVEGNCVVARRGGEQPETEGWSPTKVNSIRHVPRASLLGKGETCRASGESVTVQGLPILETGRSRCGWSGNDRKGAWDKWRERPGSRREGLAAGRAFIVAMKPGNAGGVKGRRKVKTPETVPDQTSSIAARLEGGSATMRGLERQRASRGHPGNGMLAQARTRWANILVRPLPSGEYHQLESRMRETRLSGSEGGAAQLNAPSLPLHSDASLRLAGYFTRRTKRTRRGSDVAAACRQAVADNQRRRVRARRQAPAIRMKSPG